MATKDIEPITVSNTTMYPIKVSISVLANQGDGAWFTLPSGGSDEWHRRVDLRGYILAITGQGDSSAAFMVSSPNEIVLASGSSLGEVKVFDSNHRELVPLAQRFKT